MNKSTDKIVSVTLVKSLSGRKKNHKLCVLGLGLKRIGQTVTLLDNDATRGMIKKAKYMLNVGKRESK